MSPKVNVIAQLEFEPTYYDLAFQHISHYDMRTPSSLMGNLINPETVWYSWWVVCDKINCLDSQAA